MISAALPIGSHTTDKQIRELGLAGLDQKQIEDARKILQGKGFEAKDYKEANPQNLAFSIKEDVARSKENLLVARIESGFIVVSSRDSLSSIEKKIKAAESHARFCSEREEDLNNSSLVKSLLNRIPENERKFSSTPGTKEYAVEVARYLDVQELALKIDDVVGIRAWQNQSQQQRDASLPLLNSYHGSKLADLADAAVAIVKAKEDESIRLGEENRAKLFGQIKMPAIYGGIGIIAFGLGTLYSNLRSNDLTSPRNEEKTVGLVEKAYPKFSRLPVTLDVQLDTYGGGQTATAKILSIKNPKPGQFELEMGLETLAGHTIFSVSCDREYKGFMDGNITVSKISGVNRFNPQVCSEAASAALRIISQEVLANPR